LEEIEGDLWEIFDRAADKGNVRTARWHFVWNVLRFFRFSNIKNSKLIKPTTTIMLRNYVKIGLRSMTKNWSTTFINIFGLSLAIACFITIWIFIDLQLNMDGFHSRKDDIHQIIMKVDTDNGIEHWGDTPYPLSKLMFEDISAIEGFFRLEFQYANVRYHDKVFQEFIVFTDPDYLKHLDFTIKSGNPDALQELDQVVISSTAAIKYFGDQDPVGKQLNLKFDGGKTKTFTIGAVLEEYPTNNSFNYGFLLPMEQFEQLELSSSKGWKYMTDANFVVLKDGYSPENLLPLLDSYQAAINKTDQGITSSGFRFVPLSKLSVSGFEIIGAVANFSNPTARVALMFIVIMLTLLASVNYMNISVAAASKRLKEIGIRKVMGSHKKQIAYQFLTENMLQVLMALVLGSALCYFLLMPGFNRLIPISVPFAFSSIKSIAGLYLGLLLFVGLLSGAYPSFYVSRFMPVDIFRGNSKFGERSVFSSILLSVQLIIAFLTFVGCFMFTDNAIHQGNSDWGYDNRNMISVRVNSHDQLVSYKDKAGSISGVADIFSAADHAGRGFSSTIVNQQQTEIRSHWMRVSPDYPAKMGLSTTKGSLFNENLDRAHQKEALVDPLLTRRMGWDDPIGQLISVEDADYRVVGELAPLIIEQWHAYGERTPIIMTVSPEEMDQYVIIKTDAKDLYAFDDQLRRTWFELSPNDPYTGRIQADVFDDFARETETNVTIIVFISIVSTILACLGLFGLLSFNIQRRVKELSVRKVLGASRISIIKLISSKYSFVIVIAFLLGGVGGYFLMIQLINGIYSEPKTNYFLPVLLAIAIMTTTIVLTIAGQIMRATRVNPVIHLRGE
jgi:putative ABC transport system permease protein